MSKLKAVLQSQMDAVACQLDCRDSLLIALRMVEKALQYSKQANIETEGQIKTDRLKAA